MEANTTSAPKSKYTELAWSQFARNRRGDARLEWKRKTLLTTKVEAFLTKLHDTGDLYGSVQVRDAGV